VSGATRPGCLLPGHDPRLAHDADPARALAQLAAFVPGSEEQARTRDEIARWVREEPTPFERANLAGHLTASALVLDAAGERALLTHHRKLERWLQLGGHCDGDANLAAVALRECLEESGIEGLCIDPVPVAVDIHAIPARGPANDHVPRHLHLDTQFVVVAPAGATTTCSDESLALGWFTPAEARDLALDGAVRRLFQLCFARS
jgi:8-oxo-dGTP pyrophosphatase MutT (NUDIX family)